MEAALAQANRLARLAVVVRDATDAITVQDLDGNTLAWNPGAQRMFGWTEAQALTMNVRERIPPGLRDEALSRVRQLSQAHTDVSQSVRTVAGNVSLGLAPYSAGSVLGLPPVWYKAPAYRSRAVIDPRGVLAEFGVTLPADKKIRVWDSTAELRYLVIPERPPGANGLSEADLAKLVSRDSMIGASIAGAPT